MDALGRNPLARLKLSAVAFAVLWTGWMLWWSGSFDRANVIIRRSAVSWPDMLGIAACAGIFSVPARFREINARPGSAAKTVGRGDYADEAATLGPTEPAD